MTGVGYVILVGALAGVLVAGLTPGTTDPGRRDQKADETVAVNFIVYRNAVNHVALSEHTASGTIPLASLKLPAGWKALRGWSNRIESGVCYVYGPGTEFEAKAVVTMLRSHAVGQNVGGHMFNDAGFGPPLPTWIPAGCIVSTVGIPEG